MNYKQLTEHERYQIYALSKTEYTQKQIAGQLKKSPLTICRELKRNLIKCIDFNNSSGDFDEGLGIASYMSSLRLDEKLLSSISINKMLIFILKEFPVLKIVHQSIKNKIQKNSVKGIRFIPINSWSF